MQSSALKIAPSTAAQPKNERVKIALLIDADNAPAHKIESILTEIAKYGVANIRRAYGNWTKPSLAAWEACLHEYAIHPVQQFDYTKGKNATDAALIIDAMDLLYTRNLDAFAIVSSDCDFTPLVMRILTNGLKAYGFGEIKTPAPFVQACSTFLYLDMAGGLPAQTSVLQAAKSSEFSKIGAKKTGKQLKQDTKLMVFLRGAIAATKATNEWSTMSAIGIYVSKRAAFDPSDYGYAKLSALFEAIDVFELDRKPAGIYVREKA